METVYKTTYDELMSDPEWRKGYERVCRWQDRREKICGIMRGCDRFLRRFLRKIGFNVRREGDYVVDGFATLDDVPETGEIIERNWYYRHDGEREVVTDYEYEEFENANMVAERMKNYDPKNNIAWGKVRTEKKEAVAV